MYPEVQVVGGGDQGVDQLHASDLWSRRTKKKGEKAMRNETNRYISLKT